MKEYMEIYAQNRKKIEAFIEESIENLAPLCAHEENNFKILFSTFPSLEIVIFDLFKTILEQEVYFKSYIKNAKIEIKPRQKREKLSALSPWVKRRKLRT